MKPKNKLAIEEEARLVYQRATQVSSVTYNLFTIARKLDSEPPVAGMSAPPEVRESVRNELIKQFPTMESLFGSMDFCECEHCRSVLSPAAYLVDLLQFVDPEPGVWGNFLAHWKATHGGQDYPHKDNDGTSMKPYDVLKERRPDLPHIPLTCENTHTALPYIDIVNEILEYFVANGKLEEEAARDTGGATTAELLAEPQNVIRAAYDKLREARYPLTLPFDLWIETVRQFCNSFETPLARVLDVFRLSDALFAPAQPFDRASIFMESLGLSPAEVALFTDAKPLELGKWHELFGYSVAGIGGASNTTNATVDVPNITAGLFKTGDKCQYYDTATGDLHDEEKEISAIGGNDSGGQGKAVITFAGVWTTPPKAGDALVLAGVPELLKSAKTLARRLGVTYREITEIVQTGFVNPRLAKLGLLYKLGVSIHDARFYLDHKGLLLQDPATLSSEDQKRRLEVEAFSNELGKLAASFGMTPAELETELLAIPFDRVLVLADPEAGCDFDLTTLRYANADPADDIVFLRINLFVRLWRRLGWSIEETDRALTAFIPQSAPFDETTANLARQPLKTALIYLAHLKTLDEKLRVGRQSRTKLITLWSDINTTGRKPLYAQLFLTRSVLKTDPVFDDPLGGYLSRFTAHQANVALADQLDPAVFAAHPEVVLRYDQQGETQYLTYKGFLSDAKKEQLKTLLPASALLASLLEDVQSISRIGSHVLALQGGLGLTADDISRILTDAGMSLDTAELSLANVSLLYRYGLLAKALRTPVRELIALRQLSGLNPFQRLESDPLTNIEKDYPFSHTLRFIEMAEEVKESGLTIEDLDYLLRHRFDETGKYRPNHEGTLALLKTLAEGVRAIRSEHAVPDDPGALSEEVLRQKLGLALTPDVVERFLAMMNGTAEFTATKTGVALVDQLKPADFADEPDLRLVSYKEVPDKEQKLTVRGVLFAARKTKLETKFDTSLTAAQKPLFAELLGGVQKKAKEFFEKHLQKQAPNVQPAAGFLDAADFDLLFDPDLALAMGETEQDRLRKRQTKLATAFLPFLQQRLIRQFIVQTMTAYTGSDPLLVESLLTDERLLVGPRSLLEALTAAGERGLSADFYDSPDRSGARQQTGSSVMDADTALKASKDKDGNPLNPANSARFGGYLEVPSPSAYRFYIALDKQNAKASLRFDHLPDPAFLSGTAAADNAVLGDQPGEFLELKPGILYPFSLDLENLNGGEARLLVQGETLPKGPVSQLRLYPLGAIAGAEGAVLLLTKALQLVQSLGLSEREIRYMLTHAAVFDGLNLSQLPTQTGGDTAPEKIAAAERFARFLRLAAYARLKRDLAVGTDDLIGIFEANGSGDLDKVYPLIARLTRRDEATVKATVQALVPAPAVPAFASEQPLQKLWEALQIVERFGVPVALLVDSTRIVSSAATPEQRFVIARDMKEAIKARFEPETWQNIAQPIFDTLRRRQRDTLVAHVMHQHGFDRLEQLYEYFLIDPGMEPVVQTSRIRLAIASVQLFIQRCLLNMELQVHPSVINSKQWEWMKRYRVWEANRKIFLFPENWLEPEFRDDKTHLFTELEGALLQDDVSSDLVEDAFLNYLKKLDELARLDIAAMHLEDNPDPARRTLHVVGRTYSQPHKYFYRRYAHQMWTPWEPVSAEIEGDHLLPVIWRDRLYLFWVTFMDKADPNPSMGTSTGTGTLTNLTFSAVMADLKSAIAKKQVDVQLHWSEYLQGEWTTRESGDFSTISVLVVNPFDPKSVFTHVSKEDEAGEERGVYIHLGGAINHSFHLAGRNSMPEKKNYNENGLRGNSPINPYTSANTEHANRYSGSGELRVSIQERITTEPGKTPPKANPSILQEGSDYTLLPCDNNLTALGALKEAYRNAANPDAVQAAIESGIGEIAALIKPVFYQDNAHTLFVEPSVTERTIEEWQDWVTRTPQPEPELRGPEWWREIVVLQEAPRKGPIPDPRDPKALLIDQESLINPVPEHDWLVNPVTLVEYEGVLIGSIGQLGLEIRTSGVSAEGGILVNVNPGSDLPSGSTVVLTDATTVQQSGLAQVAGGLNIVGRSGFNSALTQNLNESKRTGFNVGILGAGGFER